MPKKISMNWDNFIEACDKIQPAPTRAAHAEHAAAGWYTVEELHAMPNSPCVPYIRQKLAIGLANGLIEQTRLPRVGVDGVIRRKVLYRMLDSVVPDEPKIIKRKRRKI